MFNSFAYGNAGADQGLQQSAGGFFNTTSMTSPSASQEKKKNADRLTNVIACTTAQILNMSDEDENLKVGSMTAKIVTFIGWVRAVEAQSTKISFVIDDMSGPAIEVLIWIGENEELEKRLRAIQESTYVRITGAVRMMKGKRHVVAFNIVPVKEINEITMHILETIHSSMAIAVMDKQSAMIQSAPTSAQMYGVQSHGQDFNNSTGAKGGFVSHGLTKTQEMVLRFITSSTEESGMSLHNLYSSLSSLGQNTIKETVNFLSNEGHIYSTIDDDHFKSTESL